MKKIEHQIFLTSNKLDANLLLEPIQEKIEIFNRMHKLLETVSDCEKEDLLEQLEALDLEILEDFDEEYADKLNYNEIEEVLNNTELKLENVEEKLAEISKQPKEQASKKHSDESILEELVKMGRTQNIGRSTFKDLGIKTQLGWETIIGKYRVVRTSVFRYRYEVLWV